jgi:(p)ppGpp synthase/HD superfamily hydrolase
MKTIVEQVEDYIREKHKGQKRWDGRDYFTEHLLGVRKIAVDFIKDDLIFGEKEVVKWIEIMALAHDLAEDQNVSEEDFGKFLVSIGFKYGKTLGEYLKLLNKNNYDSYLDFVLGAKENSFTKIVKIADITHNLQDLKKGSMRDKYLLALHILKK